MVCKLSVVVPIYNSEKYLSRCINSILKQTFSNIEIILVDDGSTDHSYQLCKRYEQIDNRVVVIHQENRGVAAARNTGIDAAKGEFLAFVDSDDYIELQMYEKMLNIVQKYNCDVVMCDCLKGFSNYSEPYTHDIRPGFYDSKQLRREYYPHLLMMPNVEYPPTISNWLCVFRNRQHTQRALHYIEGVRYSEDLLFGAQLLRDADSFYYMKEQYLYHYDCTNTASATHRYVPDKWDDFLKLYHNIRAFFSKDTEYDFSSQIDLCLLFFVYNIIGETFATFELTKHEKKEKIDTIISTSVVKEMFSRINILNLPITKKQKLLTFCYKYQMGIGLLIKYYKQNKSI